MTKHLTDQERHLAEVVARMIATAEEAGLPDPPDKLGVTAPMSRLVARAYVELRDALRALHDLVDQTDPSDPVGTALTKVDLARRPVEVRPAVKPHLVRTNGEVKALTSEALLATYCEVMRDTADVFVKYDSYVVRLWDGMDGCWCDCTGAVGREEALRYWAEKTGGGAHHVSYAEIDYYRIFPGKTRMHLDGSEGRELFR